MSKTKFELRDVVLSLWGVVLAFTVQVLYDIFGGDFYISIMPRIWWGIGITIGLAVILLYYMKQLREEDEKQQKETGKPESIEELIEIVDSDFENKRYTTWDIVGIVCFMIIPFILISILLGILLGAFPLVKRLSIEQISFFLLILTLFVAALQVPSLIRTPLFRRRSREELADWNYQKLKKKVTLKRRLLLKALTLMKAKQPDFDLLDTFKDEGNKALFNEQKLVQRLYE